jgi:hypothetical protein
VGSQAQHQAKDVDRSSPLFWYFYYCRNNSSLRLFSKVSTSIPDPLFIFLTTRRDIQGINTSTIWAIRETFVAIIAVNAAAIKPLFSASKWLVSSKGSSRDKGGSSYIHGHGHALATIGGSGISGAMSSNRPNKSKYMTQLDDNSSEEHIVGKSDFMGYSNKGEVQAGSTMSGRSDTRDGIMVTRTYEVTPVKSTLDV